MFATGHRLAKQLSSGDIPLLFCTCGLESSKHIPDPALHQECGHYPRCGMMLTKYALLSPMLQVRPTDVPVEHVRPALPARHLQSVPASLVHQLLAG